MSNFPVVPLETMSICDCETPSAVNGYSLWIVNYPISLWFQHHHQDEETYLESTLLDPVENLFGVLCEFFWSANERPQCWSSDLETLWQ